MKSFRVTGYPSGFTDGAEMMLAASNTDEATAKATALLRSCGCNDELNLSVSEYKPLILQRYP